ncbi:MAG TPA: hypothetical protein VGH99_00400 [Pseudonocardia sp.]
MTEETAVLDPIELSAIGADDELLDMLAGRRPPGGPAGMRSVALDPQHDLGVYDDQRMQATLAAWRADVLGEPLPELCSVDEASKLIIGGARPARRRLMPVAAAAAVLVIAGAGLAAGVGTAQPGDALWGVSTMVNGDAASGKAAAQLDTVLVAARTALAEGRISDAKEMLRKAQPTLKDVADPARRADLERMAANLNGAAEHTPEGKPVHTDERGTEMGHEPAGQAGGHSAPSTGGASADPRTADPRSAEAKPGHSTPPSSESSTAKPTHPKPESGPRPDPRSAERPTPRPEPRPRPEPTQQHPQPQQPPAQPEKTHEPAPTTTQPDRPAPPARPAPPKDQTTGPGGSSNTPSG